MPFHVGVPELIVILMILLLVFGASRLPQLGESMGRAIRGFKRGVASDDAIEVNSRSAGTGASSNEPAARDSDPTDADLIDRS